MTSSSATFRVEPRAAIPDTNYWFPGRWLGGASLVLAPLLLLLGVLLRVRFHFFFPQQLAAFEEHPGLMRASYSAFVLGNVLLWPAIATLARRIGAHSPTWALWGGALAMFGLFARTFHAGVDHLAFQLVSVQNLEQATRAVGDQYGAFYVLNTFNLAILAGWLVLAVGAYRSGTLGLPRSIALALMSALMLGVLKGTSWTSVAATAGLCVALVPLGLEVLRDGPRPSGRSVAAWMLVVILAIVVFAVVGQLG